MPDKILPQPRNLQKKNLLRRVWRDAIGQCVVCCVEPTAQSLHRSDLCHLQGTRILCPSQILHCWTILYNVNPVSTIQDWSILQPVTWQLVHFSLYPIHSKPLPPFTQSTPTIYCVPVPLHRPLSALLFLQSGVSSNLFPLGITVWYVFHWWNRLHHKLCIHRVCSNCQKLLLFVSSSVQLKWRLLSCSCSVMELGTAEMRGVLGNPSPETRPVKTFFCSLSLSLLSQLALSPATRAEGKAFVWKKSPNTGTQTQL